MGADGVDRTSELNEDMLPFAKLLGIRFLAADTGRVLAELVVREELCTRPAVIHGGAVMAFADTLGAAGTILNLPAGARTTTIESKTNFLAAAPVGCRLVGETTPVHRGKTTMVWQTRIATDAGRLVALVTQTQLVLPPGP
jgi:1,4-dihydroxy-2-naphthoyl-CoA hydrolase